MEKIKLVVYDNCILGYINPENPLMLHCMSYSVLRGAGCFLGWAQKVIESADKIKLASEKDFDDFRVCFDGYKKHPEEYEFQN